MNFDLENEDVGLVWAIICLVLGIMGLGTWLVVEGHSAGWWLIALPLIVALFI